MMMSINWDISPADQNRMDVVKKRLSALGYTGAYATELCMSVQAPHANGTHLNLEQLIKLDDRSFLHDVFGLDRHVSRETGQIENCFVPRCGFLAEPERES